MRTAAAPKNKRRDHRVTGILVSGLAGGLLALAVVRLFAPGVDAFLAIGLGVASGLAAGYVAGNVGEAVMTIFVSSIVLALALTGLERPDVRAVGLSIYSGIVAGQVLMSLHNEFLRVHS